MKINSQISLTALTLLATPGVSFADKCGYTNGKITPCGTSQTPDVLSIIQTATDWILGFAGAIAVLFIIWGGLQYLTAAGNEKQVASAKLTLTNAVMGIIVILLAYVIITLVVSAAGIIAPGV